jgi:hypothetical protein
MRASFLLTFCCLGGIFARAQDVIYLKSGESIACQIEGLTDKIVNFSLLSNAGTAGGSARRTIQTDLVDYVELDFEVGEAAFFPKRKEATEVQLKSWWEFYLPHLHRPRSRAAAYGNALGQAMLRDDATYGGDRALPIFDRIIARAWSSEDIGLAKQGRLQAMMAKGDLEAAVEEAKALAKESDDPGLLIEVNYLLAKADFQKLKELEEEHPKWEEDEEVRPVRNELFHRTVDQFLHPHLFHATREIAAARGLFAVAEVYHFAHDDTAARDRWTDLTHLYPETEFAELAKARLDASKPTTDSANAPP